MRAAIVSIGDELITGDTADGNGPWLAEAVAAQAATLVERRVVPDDQQAIGRAVAELAGRSDVLILTGGLGPTPDDLTRQALGDAMAPGRPLVEDAEALQHLQRFFAGRRMPAANRVQAQRPEPMRLLPNPRGTAPGLAGRLGGCRVFALPGPPAEMRPMFRDHVSAALKGDGPEAPRQARPGAVRLTAAVHAYGLGESAAAERLGALLARDRQPRIGLTVSTSIVTARITAIGPPDRARQQLDESAQRVQSAWAPWAYGRDGLTLPAAVGALLAEAGLTLATAESCTGGLLGGAVTGVPGSSAWYAGGWVTYSDALKQRSLGVQEATLAAEGAVSEPVARQMAEGALQAAGADVALSITGIAGPAGGRAARPVGTVFIGLARRGEPSEALCFRFPGQRADVRDRSVKTGLQMLRFALLGAGLQTPLLWRV